MTKADPAFRRPRRARKISLLLGFDSRRSLRMTHKGTASVRVCFRGRTDQAHIVAKRSNHKPSPVGEGAEVTRRSEIFRALRGRRKAGSTLITDTLLYECNIHIERNQKPLIDPCVASLLGFSPFVPHSEKLRPLACELSQR